MRPKSLRNVTGATIAHRGLFTPKWPENSLEAIVDACEKGHWVEFDIRLSRDGKVVIFHDEDLLRSSSLPSKVADLSSEELQKTRIFGSQCTIPLFRDLLSKVPPHSVLVVELKSFCGTRGFHKDTLLEKAVLKELEGFSGRALLKSFNPFSVTELLSMTQDHSVGFLSCDHLKDGDFPFADQTQARALQALSVEAAIESDFISYGIQDLSPELSKLVREQREQGLMTWTVRNLEQRQKAQNLAHNYIFEAH